MNRVLMLEECEEESSAALPTRASVSYLNASSDIVGRLAFGCCDAQKKS
jgi:hypothetical protein